MEIKLTEEGTVHREYRKATEQWPYPLPHGYRWPSTPRFPDEPFGRGEALVQAYLDWTAMTGLAALRAYLRGDIEASRRLLSRLQFAYGGELRRALIIDEEDGEVRDVIEPALRGDFAEMVHRHIEPYLEDVERAAIARTADDR